MSRTFKIIFTLSVVLNLLLVGAVGSFALKMAGRMPGHDPAFKEDLTPETRHLMARTFRERHDEIKTHIKKGQDSRKALMDVMAAEKFDPEAYDRAVEDLIAVKGEMMRGFAGTVRELAKDLPVEERKKLGRHLADFGRPGGHRHQQRKMRSDQPVPDTTGKE
ncbi:MAG: periplasmic heavy metal sensor [Rhodospirillales bacterium]|nr:periplasmic heavy metal sensor [Rhodospirillales bacterium]